MSDINLYKPSSNIVENSHVNHEVYEKMYEESINSPSIFWAKHGKRIDWIKPYSKVNDVSYNKDDLRIKWFEDGTLNASAQDDEWNAEQRGANDKRRLDGQVALLLKLVRDDSSQQS